MAAASSSHLRRLSGLFTLSRSPAARPIKADPSPETPLPLESRLQNLVTTLIKNSESPRVRNRVGPYESAVRVLALHKRFSMIEDLIESQKKYRDITDEGFAIRLIKLYGKAGMFTHARKLFDELPQLKCQRTVKSFNVLLASCVNSKEYDQAETLFRDVAKEISVEPNVISYNTVINAYCEMGALDKAVLFLNYMEKNGVEPNLVTYNTIMTGFYGNGQFEDGEYMWNMLQSKNMTPDLATYSTRLRGMARENKIEEGIALLAEMEEKGIKLEVPIFYALIKGFCEGGNIEEAKKWYYKMKENGAVPNGMTYRVLLPFLCEKGDWDMALELAKEALHNNRLVAAEAQLVVDGLVQVSRIEEAKGLVELCNSKSDSKFTLELPQTST